MDKEKFPDYDSDDSVYLLFEDIHQDSCREVIQWILDQNYLKKHKVLHLVICSDGGDANAGFALIDIIAGSKIPVNTVGLGIIASMGFMVFLTGKTRILTPNTMVLSHQFSNAIVGKEHELIACARSNVILSDIIISHIKKYTGLSEKKIKNKLLPPSDIWLTAKDCVQLDVCDKVIDFGN